jgi:hypothetical protein
MDVYYHVHKSPLSISIHCQMHPVHNFWPYFLKIHYNIIFPSMPRSSVWFLSFNLSNQNIKINLKILKYMSECQNFLISIPHVLPS